MAELKKKKYYPQHMHIHSVYEPGSSMEGHIYFAKKQGMEHIWFTEHDVFWKRKPYKFGFEPSESAPDEKGRPTSGFSPTCDSNGEVVIDTENYYEGSSSMRLTAGENPDKSWRGAAAVSIDGGICHSLCCLPTLSFAYRGIADKNEDVRYVFDICLSERPPDQGFAHIIFVSGSTEGLAAPHTLILPVSVNNEWQQASFDLSAIASSADAVSASVGGLDNVFSYFTVRVETRYGASASLFIDSVSVEGRTTAEETKKQQTELAIAIGKEYGVTPFVTAEISGNTHKNCFSTNTPIFDYRNPTHKVTHEEACRVMRERNLVFSLNHPFVYLKGKDPQTVDYDAECDALVEKLASDNLCGASLLEVGFPFGRYAPYTTHSRLWDSLAMRGILLTGYGSTDSHMMTEGWFSGNNFAGFVGIDEDAEPTEERFIEAMRGGALYSANPLVMKGEFSFTADVSREMGSVSVVPRGFRSRVKLSLGITNHNWKVAWVVNGERVRLDPATRMGYRGEYELTTSEKIDFVRAEVYDYFGTLLLMTNPIYFTTELGNIKNDTQGRIIYYK